MKNIKKITPYLLIIVLMYLIAAYLGNTFNILEFHIAGKVTHVFCTLFSCGLYRLHSEDIEI